jgi:hypothetical protein
MAGSQTEAGIEMTGFELNLDSIEAEYRRLGHTIGWRFLTSPEKNIGKADVALVTQNPGGDVDDPNAPRWSVENGNAYAIESWRGVPAGQDPLQIQVKRMFEVLSVDINSVFSGYFVPFRSPDWNSLNNRSQPAAFGRELWKAVFSRSPATLVLAFGRDIAKDMGQILGASNPKSASAHWGNLTIDSYICRDHKILVVLPHLSRFRLFYRPDSERSFKTLVETGRRELT